MARNVAPGRRELGLEDWVGEALFMRLIEEEAQICSRQGIVKQEEV